MAFGGEHVAVGPRKAADEAVGAEQRKEPVDSTGEATLAGWVELFREENGADVAVPEAGDREFAAADGSHEVEVGGRNRSQAAVWSAATSD